MATRQRRASKYYLNAEGERSTTSIADWSGLGFDIFDPDGKRDKEDKPIVVDTVTLDRAKFPDAVIAMAAGHGILQKIGDEYSSAKSAEMDIVEVINTMAERLQSGEWNTPRGAGSGPRPSMVMEAVKRALVQAGEPEDKAATIAAAATDSDEKRKAALADAGIKAIFETVKLEKQKERAQAAAKAAKESGDGGFLAGLTG